MSEKGSGGYATSDLHSRYCDHGTGADTVAFQECPPVHPSIFFHVKDWFLSIYIAKNKVLLGRTMK